MVSYFLGKSLKLMPPDALILAQNAPKCVWTRWGSFSAPPDPLAAKRGPTSKGRGREDRGGMGEEGRGEGRRKGKARKGKEEIGLGNGGVALTHIGLQKNSCGHPCFNLLVLNWFIDGKLLIKTDSS